jgi:hypothetical protein
MHVSATAPLRSRIDSLQQHTLHVKLFYRKARSLTASTLLAWALVLLRYSFLTRTLAHSHTRTHTHTPPHACSLRPAREREPRSGDDAVKWRIPSRLHVSLALRGYRADSRGDECARVRSAASPRRACGATHRHSDRPPHASSAVDVLATHQRVESRRLACTWIFEEQTNACM